MPFRLSTPSHSWWIICIALLLLPVLFRPVLAGSDPKGYYAWLHSAVIDGDLNVNNEFSDLAFTEYHHVTTDTGYRYNHWSPGPALLWSPLYGLTHLLMLGLRGAGLPWPADGYSLPYVTAAAFSSTLYGLAALLLLFDLARRLFTDEIALLAVLTLWLASPLVFYMYSHPVMSHAVDFFANALFLWVWQRTRHPYTIGGWVARGAATGLAAIIRPQNALLLLVPAAELLAAAWRSRHAQRDFVETLGLCAGFALGLALFLVPQMIFWRVVYGHWLYNPYAITYALEGTVFDPLHPHLWELAFSTNHGLFLWSPVLLFAVVGLFLLYRRDRRLALLVIVTTALQFFAVSSLSTWQGGGPSFGTRYLIGILPALALGFAAFLERIAARLSLRALVAMCALFIAWNLLLIVQYALETIPRSGPLDVSQMIRGQFTVIPENFARILRAFRTRSQ